jgi:adenylosuccinate synthetase
VFVPRFTRAAEMAQKRFNIEIDIAAELQRYREFVPQITPMIVDGVDMVNSAYEDGKKILLEGANGVMLDIDYGTYPYVTSSHPYCGGGVTGLGIAPHKVSGLSFSVRWLVLVVVVDGWFAAVVVVAAAAVAAVCSTCMATASSSVVNPFFRAYILCECTISCPVSVLLKHTYTHILTRSLSFIGCRIGHHSG